MTDLNNNIDALLTGQGLAGYKRAPLAGDASNRHYERIHVGGKTFMLMVAPPATEDVRPFLHMDEILLGAGLNAPDIISQDVENGLLLLEDFGDDSFSNVLRVGGDEQGLYTQAIEVLDQLPRDADLPKYSVEKMLQEVLLYIDWRANDADKASFVALWEKLISQLSANNGVVMRDYHADNLMWLPARDGVQKVGLLDFQDAVIGNVAYDYVSLLEDARRDVSADVVAKILRGKSEEFLRDYAILGAQRNLKIIGIFHRLNKRDGKPRYLDFLPRVWAHFRNDLQHPALAPLKTWFEENSSDAIAA